MAAALAHHEELENLREENLQLRKQLSVDRDTELEDRLAAAWRLTGTEARIMSHLYRRKGGLATSDSIMTALYGMCIERPEDKIVDVYICKMRKKMGDLDRELIVTLHSRGYCLSARALELCEEAAKTPRAEIETLPDPVVRDRKPRGSGITLKALRYLSETGPCTAPEIGQAAGRKGPEAHAVVSYLMREEMVQDTGRRQDTGFKRKIYALSPKGLRYVEDHEGIDV